MTSLTKIWKFNFLIWYCLGEISDFVTGHMIWDIFSIGTNFLKAHAYTQTVKPQEIHHVQENTSVLSLTFFFHKKWGLTLGGGLFLCRAFVIKSVQNPKSNTYVQSWQNSFSLSVWRRNFILQIEGEILNQFADRKYY